MTVGSCSGPPSVPYFSISNRSKNSSISAMAIAGALPISRIFATRALCVSTR
ncbi:hypothetical protein D3C71_1991720 [compost metagenome]